MTSNIILYRGKPTLKETDLEEKQFISSAFLTEYFAGIRANGENEIYESQNTYRRCILAAIRGAQLAQELKEISDENLVSCFHGGLNTQDYIESIIAETIYKDIPPSRVNQIRNFVPLNIENILGELVNYKIPFDSKEILEEIKSGRINNSSTIADIIHENERILNKIDKEEYGQFITMADLLSTLDTNFYNRRQIFRPFLDEYFLNFDNKNYKIIEYGSVNQTGFLILSKLKNHKNLDFDLRLTFKTEYSGDINNISAQPVIHTNLGFRKSSDKVHASIFTPEFLESSYGYSNFRLDQKLPVLARLYHAILSSEEGEIQTTITDGELIEQAGPLRYKIQRRRYLAEYHDILSIN